MLKAVVRPHDLVMGLGSGLALRLDAEGRWCFCRLGPGFYRRAMDGSVIHRCGETAIAFDPAPARRLHEEVLGWIRFIAKGIEERSLRLYDEPPGLRQRLREALEWTPGRYAAQARCFRAAYPESVSILPPDRYRDVVLLPAVGCPWGRCPFCTFYANRPFRILSRAEFEKHVESVLRLFGRALGARTGVFLGSASALSLPQARLLEILEIVARRIGPRPRGVAAFHDPDHSPGRTLRDYEALRALSLAHMTVGLETGDASLRVALGKSGSLTRVTRALTEAKAAGLRVAITVLVGPGGAEAADRHRIATCRYVGTLGLEEKDLVYLSPLEGGLPRGGLQYEVARFTGELAAVTRAQVAPYRMELFRYYA